MKERGNLKKHTDAVDMIKYLHCSDHDDVKTLSEYYDIFLSILNQQIDLIMKENLSNGECDNIISTQLYNYSVCSSTILYLSKGIESPLLKEKIIDYPSMYVLRRYQIESYLSMAYLHFNPKSKNVIDFRFDLYVASGYKSRQRAKGITFENRVKKIKENLDMVDLSKSLLYSKEYFKLNRNAKKKTNQLEAKYKTFEEIISESDLNRMLFLQNWRLYSSYAHGEYIANIQTQWHIKKPKELVATVARTIDFSMIGIVILIDDVANKFDKCEKVFDNISNSKLVLFDTILHLGRDISPGK